MKPRLRWDRKRHVWRDVKAVWRCALACACGVVYLGKLNSKSCPACSQLRLKRLKQSSAAAHLAVAEAIRQGTLPAPHLCRCKDCGDQASMYDHRDYSKPLEVDPVCASCNQKRGPAIQQTAIILRFQRRVA